MNVRVIALYPGRLSDLAGRLGVRFRSRKKKGGCTVVPCKISDVGGRSVATPEYPVPEGTPNPVFRAQFVMERVPVEDRHVVCVVLSAEPDASKMDPEQLLLSPIFDDGHQMIFEFRRAHILTVHRRGDVETRLIAIDPVRGIIGTKTIHRFNIRLSGLANRCAEYLAGAVDLFPPRDRAPMTQRVEIPTGAADLSFGPRGRPTRAPSNSA